MKKEHALVIGGTGMLSDVTLWLIKKGYVVTVIGRRNETYKRLLSKVDKPKNLKSIIVDYHDTTLLIDKLKTIIKDDGAFDLIVSWVHSSAPEVNPSVLELVDSNRKAPFDFFHVKSSTSYINKEKLPHPAKCNFYEVYLGFKIVGNNSRWLTHQEICEGVKDSIHHKRKQTIVGQLEPWDRRP